MGANSHIEWTHHTFNPWRGCTKVSQGCKHCYAETLSKRNPKTLGEWGPRGQRVIAAESYWRQPVAWNKAAERAGERHRVFCASLADVFEGPDTMPTESWPLVHAARGRAGIGFVRVVRIVRADSAGILTEEEAMAEGFRHPNGFRSAWVAMHGQAALDRPCWRLTIQRVAEGDDAQ